LQKLVTNYDVSGFPNLNWNKTHVFDSLPTEREPLIDSTITLANDASFLRRLTNNSVPVIHAQKEHTIIVFWSYIMGRQSKRLIELAKKSHARHPDDYDLYFVAADNMYKY
jgi:hypothetical protein